MSSLRVLVAAGEGYDRAVVVAEVRRVWSNVSLDELDPSGGYPPGVEPGLLLVADDMGLEDALVVLHGTRRRWPDLPAVLLARSGSEETVAEAMRGGFDGVVSERRLARLAAAAQAAIQHRGEAVRARQAEARLLQTQKLEAVGRLAAGIAHDFNNLLGVIDGYAALIAETTPEPDERHAHALEISRASRRGADLTTRLLAFAPQQVPAARDLDLREVVWELARALDLLVPDDIVLTVEAGDDPVIVHGDAGRLGDVIVNLVTNAADAIQGGGTIVLRVTLRGPEALLEVEDMGSGIGEDVLPLVFEPFFTTKEQGRGLGLSTAYSAISEAGGRIGVISSVGRGTTVTVMLPLVDDSAQPRATAVLCTERPRTGSPGEDVLVVEDSDELRQMLRSVLESTGFAVRVAADGRRALESIHRHGAPAAVIADVEMPNMGGLELARRLEKVHPEVRILLVSGYAPDEAIQDLEVRDFLRKPFTPAELGARLRALLDR